MKGINVFKIIRYYKSGCFIFKNQSPIIRFTWWLRPDLLSWLFYFSPPSFHPEHPNNVVGRAKGQGQTLETVIDRRRKEANKSRVSNHNRRTMADRKRNKGMIPSWPVWRWCAARQEEGRDSKAAEVWVSEGLCTGLMSLNLVPDVSPQSHLSFKSLFAGRERHRFSAADWWKVEKFSLPSSHFAIEWWVLKHLAEIFEADFKNFQLFYPNDLLSSLIDISPEWGLKFEDRNMSFNFFTNDKSVY